MTAAAPGSRARLGLGLRGLWLVLPIAALLAAGAGGPATSLRVLAPVVSYSLALIAMVAFWWNDWPGTRLRASWAGWADTALIVAGAIVLTGVGHALAAALFDGPVRPATLALAGAVFVVMLELTLVGEGWPLKGLPALGGGLLALSWALAIPLVLIARPGPELGAALVCVGAWQVLCFVVWPGLPWSSRVASHAVVVGGGVATSLLAGVAIEAPTITAAAGCFVAAGLLVGGMLFEAHSALAALLLAAALFGGLSALADAFGVDRDAWVTHASLNVSFLHDALAERLCSILR